MQELKIKGIYKHFKGDYYLVEDTATTLTMMAIRFEKNYKYASELFAFTTVLSIFTIPFIAFIAGFFL